MAINLVLTLTLNGKDAFWNSKNTGVKLDITHLQFGTRNRLTTGEESYLNQPKQFIKIQNGSKIGPDQVRIMATMPGVENYNIAELGLWSGEPDQPGSILIAYTSVRTGFIAQMVNGIDLVFTYDMLISTADIDQVNIVKDTDQSSTFSLLAVHEVDRNAHPYYVTTDTAQTISGGKTFSNKAVFTGGLSGELTGNAATATQLKTPRTVSFSGAATGSFSFDGSQNASGVLTLANSGVVAGTYGTLLKIPVITANIKGLITGLSEQQIPIVDDLVTGGATKLLSAEQGKKLQYNKVEKNKSFADAFGGDIDHYIIHGSLQGFTSCADFPVGSRILLDAAIAFPDIPNIDGHVYIETKRTFSTPGRLQIAYGYFNARIATRAAGTGGGYSDWVYTVNTTSISRYRQDLDATRIYSPNLQRALGVTDSGVDVSDLRVSGSAYCSKYKSNSRVWFTDHTEHLAQGMDIGSLFVGDTFSEDIYTPAQGIYAKGVIHSAKGFQGKLIAKDSRIFKPYHAENGGIAAYFVTEVGLNNDYVGGNYGDFLLLNTYQDQTAGMQNGLFFDKAGKRIVHYQSDFGAVNWGWGKTLAYAEDVLPISGGTVTGALSSNSLGVSNVNGDGNGLSLHGGAAGAALPFYGISFAKTDNYGKCGYVNGDWATYFTMTGGYNRGWIFRSADFGNVASISSQGLLSILTMKMDRSNFQIEHYSTFSIYYDFATRIVRIIMKVQSAAGIGGAVAPFKWVDGRYTATFSLPITLQLRLSAEFHFNNVGPGYTPWYEEAAEWLTWCAPVGLRGSTESAVTVDIMRWVGGKGEAIDGYLIVTGFF